MKYLIISLLITNYAFSQNYITYHNYVNEAEYWAYQKKTQNAVFLYEKAFSAFKPFWKDIFLAAKCYAMLGEHKRSSDFLYLASSKIGPSTAHFMQQDNETFKGVLDSLPFLLDSLKKIERKKREALSRDSLYQYLNKEAEDIFTQDQSIRKRNEHRVLLLDEESFHSLDSSNQIRLLKTMEKHGYPGYPVIGVNALSTVLVHIQNNLWDRYLSLAKQSLITGKMLPFEFAEAIDRMNFNHSNACTYRAHQFAIDICKEDCYEEVIKNRLSCGVSIFFQYERVRATGKMTKMPWFDSSILKKFLILD